MDCSQVKESQLAEQAEEYVGGRLSPELQDQFEVHLLECPSCLARVETLSALRISLEERAHEIRPISGRRPLSFPLVWKMLAASLLVACVLGLYYFRAGFHHEQDNSTRSAASTPAPPSAANSNTESAVQATLKATGSPNPTAKLSAPKERNKTENAERANLAPKPIQSEAQKQAVLSIPPVAETAPAQENAGSGAATKTIAQVPDRNKKSPRPMSDDVAVELYWLGSIKAPPYTFAGFAASEHSPRRKKEIDTMTSPEMPIASGRALFQEGMTAYVDGDYANAVTNLENAHRAEPKAADVSFYLGICYLLQGRPADSLPLLKTPLAAPVSPLTQPAHFYLGKALVQMQQLADAQNEMKEAANMPGRLRTEAGALVVRIQALRKTLGDLGE